MLWVYAGLDVLKTSNIAKEELPQNYLDLSKVFSENLGKAIIDYCNHHKTGHLYLGYLDPLLMLHPIEETLMRRGFEQCDMTIVVSNPLLLPLSWKNGTSHLRIVEGSVKHVSIAQVDNNGGSPHIQDEVKHRRAPAQTSDKRDADKGGKKRSAPKGRKQKGQDKEEKS
jgi:hypothetical protein